MVAKLQLQRVCVEINLLLQIRPNKPVSDTCTNKTLQQYSVVGWGQGMGFLFVLLIVIYGANLTETQKYWKSCNIRKGHLGSNPGGHSFAS